MFLQNEPDWIHQKRRCKLLYMKVM